MKSSFTSAPYSLGFPSNYTTKFVLQEEEEEENDDKDEAYLDKSIRSSSSQDDYEMAVLFSGDHEKHRLSVE
jgi:hypothetical protein